MKDFGCDCISGKYHVEGVPDLSFFDDEVTLLEGLLFECLCKLGALVLVHLLKELDLREKLFLLLSLTRRGILDDVVEGVPI